MSHFWEFIRHCSITLKLFSFRDRRYYGSIIILRFQTSRVRTLNSCFVWCRCPICNIWANRNKHTSLFSKFAVREMKNTTDFKFYVWLYILYLFPSTSMPLLHRSFPRRFAKYPSYTSSFDENRFLWKNSQPADGA